MNHDNTKQYRTNSTFQDNGITYTTLENVVFKDTPAGVYLTMNLQQLKELQEQVTRAIETNKSIKPN